MAAASLGDMEPANLHHQNGSARVHWDNASVESLIAQYQTSRDQNALSEIVALTHDRALTLIRFRKTARYRSESELLSDINFKLLRAVDKFDPAKGSAFTFVSCLITNTLCTSVSNARKNLATYRRLSRSVMITLESQSEDRSVADDIGHKIRSGVKTALSDPAELAAQRCRLDLNDVLVSRSERIIVILSERGFADQVRSNSRTLMEIHFDWHLSREVPKRTANRS